MVIDILGGEGTMGYYDGAQIVIRNGGAMTLAHELAHAAEPPPPWYRAKFDHDRAFAERLRLVYGTMMHCRANGDDHTGWDGKPDGTVTGFDDYFTADPNKVIGFY